MDTHDFTIEIRVNVQAKDADEARDMAYQAINEIGDGYLTAVFDEDWNEV